MTKELEEARERLERAVADLAAYDDACTLARAYGGPTMLPRHPIDDRRAREIAADLRLLLSAPKVEVARHGVYVASRASTPERPAMWRALRDAGHPIIATWIDEAGEGETACNAELWQRIEREVTGAERLVLYVEPQDFPLKGAYVEVGMALAAGVPVKVVAPGVEMQPHTLRPLGSWAKHPLVTFCDTVEAALSHTGGGDE